MRRLIRKRFAREERGAIAVTVALGLTALLVVLAFVVDVGLLYFEKAELQNGADSAALAVAQECALHASSCEADADDIAVGYSGGNANDDLANAVIPSGTFVVNAMSGKVTVRSSTLTEEGAALQHPLASMLGLDPTTLDAQSTAEWGTPVGGTTQLALTIAECEFDDLPPQEADTTNPTRTWLLINNGPSPTGASCASGAPGGFGWLDGTNCSSTISIDATVPGETGIQPNINKNGCDADVLRTKLCQTLLIPLYTSHTGGGSNATFTISRFAAFKLTGLKTSGGAPSGADFCGGSVLPPSIPGPPGNSKGIQGYFVKYVDLGEDFEVGEGPEGGLSIVRLIG
ncbi:hypothetical protein GCM10009747_34040 [Agromyces humatus]|uniref:Putative Flp pilus-assembly TadG-like N-terminal domain-containing protein n=1 Tax=Agromyces humatus TaxID=279573 RepID=A0ABN2KZ71_9MICO